LGGAADEELLIQPHYPANISRRRQGVGDDVALLRTGKKKPMVVEKAEWEKDCRNPAKEPIGKLLGILVLELLRIVLRGGLLGIQVAGVILARAEKLLESSATCRKCVGAKKPPKPAAGQEARTGIWRERRKRKRKKTES